MAFASAKRMSPSMATKVLVTGAGGRTGGLVFKKLLERDEFEAVGMVRGEKSANKLKKAVGGLSDGKGKIVFGNIADPDSVKAAVAGCDAIIIATSAVPKIKPLSIAKLFFLKVFGGLLGQEPGRPEFYWEPNGNPEQVDWIGQKNQIDAAKAAGVKQVVIVSSMGGTQPDNFLNTIGKDEDGKGGDILLWKRKAEKYLVDSRLKYTIIHPGGLLDKEGGKRTIVMGTNDELLKREKRSIPRADVAEVCVQSLLVKSAINRSIDIISEEEGEGAPTTDFNSLFKSCKGNCNYSFMGNPM
eukprot:CAMPEP_0117790734 /NCGR_PEP_ID=MMETSP0948-20121206/8441_1 /TAXON_ID=44440 /ORGANISM="Chattonella subsalsa, Strain CCMP2191" /LENGTH=298 /DNA_ID=CAMNT_0005620659 /DNA_START=158 /DNA_END=1054 /DNA_ORIENTATION=+